MAPGLDAQVFYSSWPPEAIENLRSARAYSPRSVAQVQSSQKSRTAPIVVVLAVLVLVAIASVGLGVGLTRRKQDSESSNTLRYTIIICCFERLPDSLIKHYNDYPGSYSNRYTPRASAVRHKEQHVPRRGDYCWWRQTLILAGDFWSLAASLLLLWK